MPPGFRRSRALWDEARRPHAPWTALARAILYELQPLRFSAIDFSRITASARSVSSASISFCCETVPWMTEGGYRLVRNMTRRHFMILGGVIVYYYAVRLVHHLLDAGPLVIIMTGLVAIFTIGLDDNSSQDGVSAYSVFNRGFERILGTVDAEALVQQHVGGAMGLAGAAGGVAPPGPVEPMRRHEQEQAPAAARRRQQVDEEDEEEEDNVARVDNGNDNNNVGGSSRKSGKKARRRNLEQKRELQRQRDAAMAMGFTGNEGEEEAMAMQRLLEEQIAAANNNGQ